MCTYLRRRSSYILGGVVSVGLFAGSLGTANGQAGGIGARGGQTVPVAPTVPSTPVLPPVLDLPPQAASSLLKGLDASGTALRPGMGWLVSDLTHQGIKGRQLADVIHQLKPYRQRGVLAFPQETAGNRGQFQQPTGASPRLDGRGHGHGHGSALPGFGKGRGGKGGRK